MNNRVGNYLRQCREKAGLTPQQVVQQLGYKRLDRGANRIIELEKWGPAADMAYQDSTLLTKVVELLNPDRQKLKELHQADVAQAKTEYEEWASVPIKPYLIRFGPGVPSIYYLSDKFTLEEAIKLGIEFVRWSNRPAYVVLSRRKSLRINRDGTTEESGYISHWTSVGGRRMSVAFGDDF